MTAEVVSQFQDLTVPKEPDLFNAVLISSSRGDFLGKDHLGSPVFLIVEHGAPTYRPAIRHQHLTASFGASCRFSVDGDEKSGRFSVVGLVGSSEDLHELFIRCVQASLSELPPLATGAIIEATVGKLLRIFEALARPSPREISGLWAELFCIYHSGNIKLAMERWHSSNFETYDFSWTSTRCEVKATLNTIRIHEFSLDQLTPPVGGVGNVFSLMLRKVNDGFGVIDLAKSIESSLGTEQALREKLWSQVLQALGRDFSSLIDIRFDAGYAAQNLAVLMMDSIPSVESPSNPCISGIRFRVDLTGIPIEANQQGVKALAKALTQR